MIRNKPEERSQQTATPKSVQPEPSFSAPSAPVTSISASSKPAAVIGPKIRFKGELVGEEDLLIQGEVDGTIDLKGNTLTIGEQGVVKANVLAQAILIEGTVEGDIFGEERISIKSSSNVKGNLVAERVTLEDGANFKGSIDMEMESRKADFEQFNASSNFARQTATPSLKVNKESNG